MSTTNTIIDGQKQYDTANYDAGQGFASYNNPVQGATELMQKNVDSANTPVSYDGSRYGRGNIDLHNRPVVKNADGSISTVKSMSIGVDGKEVLIPQVVNGKVVTPEEAIAHYKQTGEHLGQFDNVEDANRYAQTLHESQASMYATPLPGPSTIANQNAAPKANIKVDPNVQTRGNVFVKQPNAPTNNKWLGKNGVSYVKDENVGTENVYGTPYTPDANLRYAPPTPTRNLTYADFRDAMYGPEAEREKRANRQAKIQAVGDALRHIGNLATTIGSDKMGRAIPQQFKTSPAQQTLAEYKAERKERDAMGYQQLLQHQKQKQQEIQNELAQRKAQRKADMDNWNMNFKVHQQKQKENQDEFNNKMALDKRGMEKEMQEFNIKIGNDKNDRENKKLLAGIKHMNNQDAVAFGNLNMRQQEHFARVAGIGGYKGDGKNESGAKKMQSLYGVLNHKGKTDLTDEQISSIYNFANKKGWLNGTDATAFKNLVTTSQDGNMSKHAMISAITAALADDKNEGGKVYLANYLIENWDFEPTTAVGLKHYTTQKTNMARKANEKKFNVNTM